MEKSQAQSFRAQLIGYAHLEWRRAIASPTDWAIACAIIALYLLLDWVSFIHPWGSTGITPWSPKVALVLALVLLQGIRFAPACVIGELIAEAVFRGAPGPPLVMAAGAILVAGGYVAAGLILSARLEERRRIQSVRDLAWLLGVCAIAGLAIDSLYLALNGSAGVVEWTSFHNVLLRLWVGDVVGALSILPVLLVVADRSARSKLGHLLLRWETVLQLAFASALLYVVFVFLPGGHVRYFFLLFLPLVWIAARHGLTGAAAALALIQIGAIAAVVASDSGIATVMEVQARMLCLTVTVLLLGVAMDERQRAQESLEQSLRLAAAGEMAAALAHELNQPLSALITYGKACQLMLARPAQNTDGLSETVNKVTAQAQRVGAIVRRLRDFLRSGSMNLEQVQVGPILEAMRCTVQHQADTAGVRIEIEQAPDLPCVHADRLELEIVLRNLFTNAIESICDADAPVREIRVQAREESAELVRISVFDSGPGIAPSMRDRLFAPFCTSKPNGMGLGLAVSRAIIEAHGGRLWADARGFGAFHVVLPTFRGDAHDRKK